MFYICIDSVRCNWQLKPFSFQGTDRQTDGHTDKVTYATGHTIHITATVGVANELSLISIQYDNIHFFAWKFAVCSWKNDHYHATLCYAR